jgi:hypothetical protein
MATNTNLSSSSAALNVNEEQCEKADFGPGEDKEKEKVMWLCCWILIFLDRKKRRRGSQKIEMSRI